MAKRKKGKNKSQSKAFLVIALMIICVGVWQMWADSANPCLKNTAKTFVDSLMIVKAPADMPQQMIDYKGFTVSFNKDKHIPNYVVWELTCDEAQGSSAKRTNDFYIDTYVEGCADVVDYKASGYDRGHMCPAADMKWDKDAMHNSFSMANMCPQAKELNTGAWNKLEDKCRQKAIADSALIIICGPVPTDPVTETIGQRRVAVPERFFKVVLSPFTCPMQGIGFIMNNGYVEGGMQKAAVSIDDVERITGYDFFSSLPDDVEAQVEAQNDFPRWSIVKKSKK